MTMKDLIVLIISALCYGAVLAAVLCVTWNPLAIDLGLKQINLLDSLRVVFIAYTLNGAILAGVGVQIKLTTRR